MCNSQLDHRDYYSVPYHVVTTLVNTLMKEIESEYHTNGKAAEHFLKSWRKFNIVAVGFQINLSEIWSTIHADLNVKTTYSWFLLSFVVTFCQIISHHRVLSKRSNWWPSHNLCSATKSLIYMSPPYRKLYHASINNQTVKKIHKLNSIANTSSWK